MRNPAETPAPEHVDEAEAGLFDAIPDIALLVDAAGFILRANRAALAWRGAAGRPLLGEHCHGLLHGAVTREACPVCRSLAEGQPVQARDIDLPSGEWHVLSLSPLADGSGFLHISRDMTWHKAELKQLEHRERAYRTLVDAMPQRVFLKDADSRILSCNSAFAEAVGRKVDELIGLTMDQLHSPALAAQFRAEDLRVMAGGRQEEIDQEFERDGRKHILHTLKVPVRDEEGRVIGLFGMAQDVTEKRQAEAALRESQMRYQAIMRNASDAILIGDETGRFIDANRHAEEMFGYTRDELLNIGAKDIHAPDNEENRKAAFREMMENGRSLFEHKLVRKDGSHFYAETTGTRVPWGDRYVFLGIFRDISLRKRLEEDRANYQEQLEQQVEERTRELRAMNRELEAFSYSVSHDLRSPLRAINGFGEALREESLGHLPEQCHFYLDRMRNATIRMGELIDGLLNLAQVSRGELCMDQVDLSALARHHAASLKEGEPQRDVAFHIEPGLSATGDPTLLRVLLENLLSNAWKFTLHTGAALIEIGRSPDLPGAFYVRDNGAGFDMQFAHKLFQPFERLHPPGEFLGTGIGLATVRRIVERHGGRVWAEGAIDQGATVYFTLTPEPTPD